NALAGDLPADGVVTGVGSIHGRAVAVMANDPTVKAGSWGPKTVEKIIRIIEVARRRAVPIVYLVDSAGARITDQVELLPGRRGGPRAPRLLPPELAGSRAGGPGRPARVRRLAGPPGPRGRVESLRHVRAPRRDRRRGIAVRGQAGLRERGHHGPGARGGQGR